MNRTLLKSKIHRATVTETNLEYEGSVMIDRDLLEAADIVEFEQVQIYDVTNGARLTTYAILGEAGSGVVSVQGAAAHLIDPGDLVIIATYAAYSDAERTNYRPKLVYVDQQNRPVEPALVSGGH